MAKLARLNMDKEEEEKFAKELSLILDYIEKLKEVDVEEVEPTSHPFEVVNVMREDVSREKKMTEKLVAAAPDKKENYIKVKTVFKSKG